MYRQIWVDPRDTPYQRIFWRSDKTEPIQIYELKTVTYGTASAPYLATKCLQQLALDNHDKFPLACPVVLRDFYVDDVLSGAESVEKAIQIRDQLIHLLQSAGFELQKWSSNSPEIVPHDNKSNSSMIKLDNKDTIKTLGLYWNCANDTLKYEVQTQTNTIPTKRKVLSTIAKIYDILGLLSPIIVLAKILLQKMWLNKLDWDDPLPPALQSDWLKLHNQLHLINTISVPRKVVTNSYKYIEIHGFSDASLLAYGACIYVRTFDDEQDSYNVNLLCARSRVAPVKTNTLPKLELCAALLLGQLLHKILSVINIDVNTTYLWTDSSIVLSWIAAPPNTWKVFVANRVAEIQTLTDINHWRHVKSKDNPADIVSRGQFPENFAQNNDLWWHGPSWLKQNSSEWPNSRPNDINTEFERRVSTVLNISNKAENLILTKYSTFSKLQRVIAYCKRFVHNSSYPSNKHSGNLSIEELNSATNLIIKQVQLSEFENEIRNLKKGKPIDKSSKLIHLNPFLDEDGFIRVGGRLKNASISYEQKYPKVLPAKHHVTKLIILHEHKNQLHAGPTATLTAIRQKYWPIAARSTVRNLLRKCHVCFRVNPKSENQLMGDLPPPRVQPSRPFLNSAVDYAGPVTLKEGGTRSKKTTKSYIALFKCLATKAVHIELVSSCTCENFLSALKRFMARRGKPASIYSDNATYFTAANRELNNLFHSSQFNNDVIQNLVNENVKWSFIPSRSPHHGGFWESGIKAIKYHLKRVVGNALLTFEEMYTTLTQIEACINSRPITTLSMDPNDLVPLTPGHFLIGDRLTTTIETDVTPIKENRLSRWQRVQQITQHFWKRWSQEYLNTLQQRQKWKQRAQTHVKPGLPVLLKEDNLHPLSWRMGIITATHPGKDGLIRTVTVKTVSGETVRALNRVCPLPDEGEEHDN